MYRYTLIGANLKSYYNLTGGQIRYRDSWRRKSKEVEMDQKLDVF